MFEVYGAFVNEMFEERNSYTEAKLKLPFIPFLFFILSSRYRLREICS